MIIKLKAIIQKVSWGLEIPQIERRHKRIFNFQFQKRNVEHMLGTKLIQFDLQLN